MSLREQKILSDFYLHEEAYLLKTQEEQKLREIYASQKDLRIFYQTHPLDYIHDKFGVKKEMIDWDLLPEYKDHKYDGTLNPLMKCLNALVEWLWVAIESATGVSKTFLAAHIALWFLDCFENSLVITTAPKEPQLKLHIWKEISKIFYKFNKGKLTELKLQMIPGSDEWIVVGFVAGVRASEESTTKAQGFHAEHMLMIWEETPGLPPETITAFINSCDSPHNLILALGNPDHQLDNLHIFAQRSNVEHIRISGFDYPNVVLDDPLFIPGGKTKIGLERQLETYKSPDHPLYLSRARGISPGQAVDALIKYEWCYDAVKIRDAFLDKSGQLILNRIQGELSLGVDVANSESGDEAAICKGKANICIEVSAFPCPDSNKLGHLINKICQDDFISKTKVKVDGIGVGAGTINVLKEYGFDNNDINFIGSAKPVDVERKLADETIFMEEIFNNLRSQAWWLVMLDLRDGLIGIPNDPELIADLTTPKWFIKRGKTCVESKEEIKKRLGRSPNKGDSFVYWHFNKYFESEIKFAIIK